MKLLGRQAAKIDPLLRKALTNARGDEVLRALMVLGSESPDHTMGGKKQTPRPSAFPTRGAYRMAMIEQRQGDIERTIGETRRALAALDLRPRGGRTGHTVVIEGPAQQILKSLTLPGVRHASLDQQIQLVRPRRSAAAKKAG